MITLADVEAAAGRVKGVAHRTPIVTSRTINALLDAQVFLKAENFQRAGAFKFRGAYNRIAALDTETRARGLVAFSSGNHAQAVALSAQLFGIPAVIVMPEDAPAAKVAATAGYGAEIVRYDRYGPEREAIADELTRERGATLVPPFEHPLIMAGQGTVALELLTDVPDLDVLVVPVGGGGLISGCATAAAALRPGIRIVGVEPEAGDDTRQSLAAGHVVSLPEVPRTILDGLQTSAPGELTFAVVKRLVDEIVTVSDEGALAAMAFLLDRLKLMVEPSGAAGVAALFDHRIDVAGKRIGVVISGGNVGHERLRELLAQLA